MKTLKHKTELFNWEDLVQSDSVNATEEML